MAQMKEQNKIPQIELSDEEITNLSDAEFKTLVIRMLTELAEYGLKIFGCKNLWDLVGEETASLARV